MLSRPFLSSLSVVFLFWFSLTFSSAQNLISISGKIIDQDTHLPIPYAHIGIASKGIGTVTNNNGQFVFHIPDTFLTEKIEVSHIGFFSKEINISTLRDQKKTHIELRPNVVLMDGVEVLETELPLTHYIQKAIKNLKNNYPSKLHLISGFYREALINEETRQYDRLLEAAVDIQDKGIKSSRDHIRLRVNELRKSDDLSDYSELEKRLNKDHGQHNQLYSLLLRNPIRNYNDLENPMAKKYNILQLMQTHLNRLKLKDVVFKGQTKIYVIEYKDIIFSGTIYIDSKDYGIHQLSTVTDLSKFSKKPQFSAADQKEFKSEQTTYYFQKIQGRYHLNLVRKIVFNGFLNSQFSDKETIYSYAERTLLINNFYTQKKDFNRIKLRETEKRDITLYQLRRPYHQTFWESYNILSLEPLNPAIQSDLELQASLEAQFQKNGQ